MPSLLPAWTTELPLQQQSVMVLALRGPDGVRKHHPCKEVVRAYRGTLLCAARYGRHLRVGEEADTFMSMHQICHSRIWDKCMREFFDSVDELPHHYYLHLAHAAQIVGYKCPDQVLADPWRQFYLLCCDDMHVRPESVEDMDRRLGDWDRRHWHE